MFYKLPVLKLKKYISIQTIMQMIKCFFFFLFRHVKRDKKEKWPQTLQD